MFTGREMQVTVQRTLSSQGVARIVAHRKEVSEHDLSVVVAGAFRGEAAGAEDVRTASQGNVGVLTSQ